VIPAADKLAEDYAAALQDYLSDGGETALHRAYELGRRAMVEGLSLLELVSLHHGALAQALRHGSPGGEQARLFEAAQTILTESLSPFEMAHREFREAVAALRQLNQMLEEEARRIAHALHDEAGQLLVSVHLAIDQVARDLPLPARSRLRDVRGLLDEIEGHLRRLAHELRPTILDDLGLLPALEFLARGVSARTGITIEVDGPIDCRLPPRVEIALYRIVQEALTNATRHAQPTRVSVHVSHEPGRVACTVRDDGVGFDGVAVMGRAGHGLGLAGMRERLSALGGQLGIDSGLGQGTRLTIQIPLEENDGD
jgi:signal transduction histidine kinase